MTEELACVKNHAELWESLTILKISDLKNFDGFETICIYALIHGNVLISTGKLVDITNACRFIT